MPKLKLTVKKIREMQTRFEIPNLLQPGPEDAKKVANVDFLAAYYFEGSRKWEKPPTEDDIEELDFAELFAAFGDSMNPEGLAGKA
jgi:hypothetical protein